MPNTPTIHVSTNITISTSNLFTATFTAPNTTDAVNGCLLYIVGVGTAGHNITVTLQESTVDTLATQTLSSTDIKANSWVYFRFGTPHTFTTTGAGAYRFKVVYSASGSHTGAADSGGANLAYLCTTNATGVPASTDYVFITSRNLGAAATITMDGTQSIGNGADTAAPTTTSGRSIGHAVGILYNGILSWDTAASATLTCKGNVVVYNGGELQMGTVASPYPTAYLARLLFDENGTTTNHGITQLPSGKITMQGVAKSSTSLWKTKFASGSGTAADPLITADAVDWSVGDEIAKGPATNNAANYNESEARFIITKNSATSYVVSASKGGAESAFTNINTDCWLVNLERNVLVDTTDTTKATYVCIQETADASNIQIKWARFETIGSTNAGNRSGFTFGGGDSFGNVDYTVFYRALYMAFNVNGSTATQAHTGLVSYGMNAGTAIYAFTWQNSPANKTLTDCFCINSARGGFLINASNSTFTRCYTLGCNTANSTVGAFGVSNVFNTTLTDCEMHCTRTRGMYLFACGKITFNNFLAGTKGDNDIDIDVNPGNFSELAFISSNFGSPTFINGYSGSLNGSTIGFQALNDTADNNMTYYKYGILRSTGAALADTTVRTAGSLGVRMAPENATNGLAWEFNISAPASSYVSFIGWFQKNAAFGTDVARVELWLPGSTAADATTTLTNVTDAWQAVSVGATYSGTTNGLATIKVYGLTTTASAYLYADDFYNADTSTAMKLAALDVWDRGLPSPLIVAQGVTGGLVWSELTSGMTAAGTIGKYVVDLTPSAIADQVWDEQGSGHITTGSTGKKLNDALTTAKFNALK